ncbi:hypothetical protein F0562_015789 [Nyssa sinensis]|uniref:Uncharacterized protein n=1 Tax=Nyssa sinensis TaxID=561372 RepID=A0A5J4ZL43_9ASTE|nr:hypothetical protein F0562_015789 [Nyssa sinensis]
MSRLAPLSEEPINEDQDAAYCSKKAQTWPNWIKNHFSLLSKKKSNLKILLSFLGCPLFPVSVHPKQPITEVSSSAQYIIEHFRAGDRLPETGGEGKEHMVPNKWLIELVVSGHKIVAGSDGKVAWRQTPWLGIHTTKGSVRPLRRALQGLDPVAVSAVFSLAQYTGEKRILGVDCFVLKLSVDQTDLAERSDNTIEMIKHVMFSYFSHRSGLLVFLEDSYLTRIQSPGASPTYWEITTGTKIEDYRTVEGVMIAHTGQSRTIITRFGGNLKAGLAIRRMEETWMIDDLAFNVRGLSTECFIPPEEVQENYPEEVFDWRSPLHQ